MLLLRFPALWRWTRTSGRTILAPVLFTLQGRAIFGVLEYKKGTFSIIDDWQGVFIILRFFFRWWCFLSSYQKIFLRKKSFLLFFFFALFLFCYILFLTQRRLWFYVVFELRALPIFVILLYYGKERSRLEARLFPLLFSLRRIHYSHVGRRSLFFRGRSFFLNQTLFAFFWIVGVLLNAGFPPPLALSVKFWFSLLWTSIKRFLHSFCEISC